MEMIPLPAGLITSLMAAARERDRRRIQRDEARVPQGEHLSRDKHTSPAERRLANATPPPVSGNARLVKP